MSGLIQKLGGLFEVPGPAGGVFGGNAPNPAVDQRMAMAEALLQAGGPQLRPISFGQVMAQALSAGQQAKQNALARAEQMKLQQAQLNAAQNRIVPAGATVLGPDNKPLFTAPKPTNPEGQIAQLNANLKSGAITKDQYDARLKLLTTRASDTVDPATVETTANMIATGQMPMLSGYVLKTPWGQAVVARVGELNKNYNAASYPAKAATLRAFSSGSQGNTVRSLNVAIAHLDTLSELADALGNNDLPALNKVAQIWKTQTGEAAPTSFSAARDIVANEIVKAVTASGGTLADREEAQHQVQASSSPEQLQSVVKTWKQLLAGQLGGLRQQYEQGTGLNDFERFLSPETIGQLQGGQAQANAAQATAQHSAPQAALLYLKAHPETATQFKQKYGYLPEGL